MFCFDNIIRQKKPEESRKFIQINIYFCINNLKLASMKRILFILSILLSSLITKAQQMSFSNNSVISILTCSPGIEVYEKFGHTAIRIKDDKNGVDVVFNYGIFSFETSGFYYKFIKGETDYQLGVYNTGNFLASYAQRNSLVWEQVLNLTDTEKRKLINSLLENYKPENRVYRYNYIFDNCSTRPRDKILSSVNSYVTFVEDSETKTYRSWIGSYLGNESWLKFGIDVILGGDADQSASFSESMFLPEVLMNELQTAEINDKTTGTRKLISERKLLINKLNEKETTSIFEVKPIVFTVILLIIGLIMSIWDYIEHQYQKRHTKIFDCILLVSTGLVGVVILYLMLFSVHPLVQNNLNILWLNPLNIILGIVMWFPKLRTPVFFYEIFNMFVLVGGLISFALSSQFFNQAAFPIIVLLLIRSASWFAYLSRRMYKRRSVI